MPLGHNVSWRALGAVLVLLAFLLVGEFLRQFYPDAWLWWLAW